jgi:hypothetical protein
VSGYLFLRYIVPVLTTPDLIYYEIPQDSKNPQKHKAIAKGLQILGKTLLAASSNREHNRNQALAALNPFLRDCVPLISQLYGKLLVSLLVARR